MFKKILVSSLFCSSIFAQNLQNVVDQINAATGNFLSEAGDLVQSGDTVSLTINEYEWVLTEDDGEYELTVNTLPSSANNLAPAVASLLANAGVVAQDPELVNSIISAEAESLGVEVQDNGLAAALAGQYGEQLQENADSLSETIQDQYSQTAAALSSNADGLNDQVNQQINEAIQNEAATAQAIESLAAEAAANLPDATIPEGLVQVNGDGTQIAEAASSLIANVDPETLNDLAEQASGAVNDNLPGNVASAVNNVAAEAVENIDANEATNLAVQAAVANNLV